MYVVIRSSNGPWKLLWYWTMDDSCGNFYRLTAGTIDHFRRAKRTCGMSHTLSLLSSPRLCVRSAQCKDDGEGAKEDEKEKRHESQGLRRILVQLANYKHLPVLFAYLFVDKLNDELKPLGAPFSQHRHAKVRTLLVLVIASHDSCRCWPLLSLFDSLIPTSNG